jgi:dienelactone hydrolase
MNVIPDLSVKSFHALMALLIFGIFLNYACHTKKGVPLGPEQIDANNWNAISRFFTVPDDFKDRLGDFRAPLAFYDGSPVNSALDWKKRRQEILGQWHAMMGPWPDLIRGQQFEILSTQRRENFTQHKVRFYWMPGEQTEGYLLVPDETGLKPAVVTVYYEPETAIGLGQPFRDYAYQLVKRGFIALSIGTTEATRNKTYALYYPSLDDARVQPLSMLAYAAANAWQVLANTEGVDSTRIGIAGHSFGGKWAMFASCLFEKFACAVWSDPGIVFDETRPAVNYWEPWYLGYHPKPWRERGMITKDNPVRGLYPELVSNGYDLTDLHALMAPRPFLVSGGSEDPPERWVALNHSVAVNRLLGHHDRVAMTNRPEHSPDEVSNEVVYQFFEYFLKPDQ